MKSEARKAFEKSLNCICRQFLILILKWGRCFWRNYVNNGATLGLNFDISVGRAALKACGATWNLGTNSAFALGPRKTTENLYPVCLSQGFPS
jgi:hypothetical protein